MSFLCLTKRLAVCFARISPIVAVTSCSIFYDDDYLGSEEKQAAHTSWIRAVAEDTAKLAWHVSPLHEDGCSLEVKTSGVDEEPKIDSDPATIAANAVVLRTCPLSTETCWIKGRARQMTGDLIWEVTSSSCRMDEERQPPGSTGADEEPEPIPLPEDLSRDCKKELKKARHEVMDERSDTPFPPPPRRWEAHERLSARCARFFEEKENEKKEEKSRGVRFSDF